MTEVVTSLAADSPVLVKRDGPIAHITLNRPEKRNAVNDAMLAGLDAFFGAIPDGVRVGSVQPQHLLGGTQVGRVRG